MADANWDEVKYLKKLRVCVIQGVAENRNNPVSVMEIINLFKSHNEFVPNVHKIGYKSIDAFFQNYPDKFIRSHNGWMCAANSLTDNEKQQKTNIMQSQQKNKKRRPVGSGGRPPAGFDGRRSGFVPLMSSSRPAYNNGTTLSQNTRNPDFNYQNSYDDRMYDDWSHEARRDNSQRGDYDRDSYQQDRSYDDRREDYGSRREDNDDYGCNYDRFEERSEFNERREEEKDLRVTYYDRYELSQSEPPKPSFGSGRSSSPSQPAAPSEPVKPKTERFSLPPASEAPPVPALGSGGSTATASASALHSRACTPTTNTSANTTTTIASPPREDVDYTDMAKVFLRHLHSIWPEKMEKQEILDVLHDQPRYKWLSSLPKKEREAHLDTLLLLGNLWKSDLGEYSHKETTKDDKVYYTYRAGHPPGKTAAEQAAVAVPMIANFLLKRPQDNTIKVLVDVLGIESRGGRSNEVLVFDFLINRTSEFRVERPFKKAGRAVVTVLPGVLFEKWRPELPEKLAAVEEEEKEEVQAVDEQQSQEEEEEPENCFDRLREEEDESHRILAEARAMVAEVSQEEEDYYCSRRDPLSTIFDRRHEQPDPFPFQVVVSCFKDLNRFYIQNEDDYREFGRLKTDMTSYYKRQRDLRPPLHLFEGQKVAFWRCQGDDGVYLRGIVTEVYRKEARVDVMDEGGCIWVDRWDIYRLAERYSQLPPLATRCSIGDFELARNYPEDLFDEEERRFAEMVTSSRMVEAVILHVEKPILIVELMVRVRNERCTEVIVAPNCFKNIVF